MGRNIPLLKSCSHTNVRVVTHYSQQRSTRSSSS
jgi:hypothetical protein